MGQKSAKRSEHEGRWYPPGGYGDGVARRSQGAPPSRPPRPDSDSGYDPGEVNEVLANISTVIVEAAGSVVADAQVIVLHPDHGQDPDSLPIAA